MAITYRDNINGKNTFSDTCEYHVDTLEGNQYEVSFHKYAGVKNTTLYINKLVKRGFGFTTRKETVAEFSYDNSGNYDGHDDRKMGKALEKKLPVGVASYKFSKMDRIALIVANALEINEYATIDIMQSFDKASWEMKAEAIIALYEMREQYDKKNELETISPEDGVLTSSPT